MKEPAIQEVIRQIATQLGIAYEDAGLGCARHEVELAWTLSGRIRIDGEAVDMGRARVRVALAWPAGNYTPAEAVAVTKLHAELAQMACLAESIAGGKSYPFGSTND